MTSFSFQINEAELDSLRGRSWIAQLIYLRALRPYMDFATGVVGGPKRRISYLSLAEEMHRDPRQGRHSADSGYPSIKELRSGLLELERDLSEPEHPRPPLLRRLNADRQLVFQLPLAATGSSASNMRGRRGADVGQTNSGRPNTSSGGVSASMNGRRGADPETAMRGIHPESGNPVKLKDTPPIGSPPADAGGTNSDAPAAPSPPQGDGSRSTERRTVKGTRLPDDWTLPDDWRRWAATERPGLDIGLEAAKFRDYWVAKTGQAATKRDWFATWRNWVRNAKPPAKANGRGNGGYHESRQRIVDYLYDFSDDDDEPMQGRSLQ